MTDQPKNVGHRYQKGQSGNPSGKSKTKWLSDALKMELAQNPQKARNIARKVIEMAEEGDLEATKLVFDRLEGRPTQAIEIDATVTNMTPDQRRQRLLELQAKVIGETLVPLPSPSDGDDDDGRRH